MTNNHNRIEAYLALTFAEAELNYAAKARLNRDISTIEFHSALDEYRKKYADYESTKKVEKED